MYMIWFQFDRDRKHRWIELSERFQSEQYLPVKHPIERFLFLKEIPYWNLYGNLRTTKKTVQSTFKGNNNEREQGTLSEL